MLNSLRRMLVRLYPRAWRERYGDEFHALLEDTPARWRDLLDVTTAALAMRLQRHSAGTVVLMSLAGLLAASGIALLRPPDFTSTARLRITDARAIPYLSTYVLSRGSLAQVRQRYNLYPNEVLKQPLEVTVEQMRNDIRVQPDSQNATEFTVEFRYPDPEKARAVAQNLVALFMVENQRQSMLSRLVGSTLEQVTAPDLPNRAQRAFPWVTWLWGAGLGVAAGLIVLQPAKRTLKVAAFVLAGLILAGAPFYLIASRYMSTAVIALKSGTALPEADIQVEEIAMPAGSPRIFRLSAIRTDQKQAQQALMDAYRQMPFAAKDLVEAPSYPFAPVSPNRWIPALCGAFAALLYGLHRTRPAALNAH